MAVGVKLSERNLEAFSKAFNQAMALFITMAYQSLN